MRGLTVTPAHAGDVLVCSCWTSKHGGGFMRNVHQVRQHSYTLSFVTPPDTYFWDLSCSHGSFRLRALLPVLL